MKSEFYATLVRDVLGKHIFLFIHRIDGGPPPISALSVAQAKELIPLLNEFVNDG